MKTPREWSQEMWNHTYTTDINVVNIAAGYFEKAIQEALHVTPHEEPPITIEELRKKIQIYSIAPLVQEYILWQQSVIKFLAKENAYEEGVKVGRQLGLEWASEWLMAMGYTVMATLMLDNSKNT